MFVLCVVKDTVRVEPTCLSSSPAQALASVIETTYVNQIVAEVGHVALLYDILTAAGGTLHPGEAAASFEVSFRLVVFRPLIGEVIVGTLCKSDKCVTARR